MSSGDRADASRAAQRVVGWSRDRRRDARVATRLLESGDAVCGRPGRGDPSQVRCGRNRRSCGGASLPRGAEMAGQASGDVHCGLVGRRPLVAPASGPSLVGRSSAPARRSLVGHPRGGASCRSGFRPVGPPSAPGVPPVAGGSAISVGRPTRVAGASAIRAGARPVAPASGPSLLFRHRLLSPERPASVGVVAAGECWPAQRPLTPTAGARSEVVLGDVRGRRRLRVAAALQPARPRGTCDVLAGNEKGPHDHSYGPYGADEDRTHDLQNAILALSQLSYSPIASFRKPPPFNVGALLWQAFRGPREHFPGRRALEVAAPGPRCRRSSW
jgi:hypothetical protein